MLKDRRLPTFALALVLDALDECQKEEDITLIIRLLAEAKNLSPIRLRVFVTSRPETPIRLGFNDLDGAVHQDLVLHDIAGPVIKHDISLFLKHELGEIQKKHDLPAYWPGEQNIQLLVYNADGLFIYAATACRFIGDLNCLPEERLPLVLHGRSVGLSLTRTLDEMYTQILKHSVIGDCNEQEEKAMLCNRFRKIVGPIVILFESPSASALIRLLAFSARIMDVTLRPLHSVLDIPNNNHSPIKLLHPSFRDFLLDKKRCQENQFWISAKEVHSNLVESCMKVMSNALKKDICSLGMPGTLTSEVENSTMNDCLSNEARYACRYWIYHLEQGEINLCDDNGKVHAFLQQHFLHWLEALSLMRQMSERVLMITVLQSMLSVSDAGLLGF